MEGGFISIQNLMGTHDYLSVGRASFTPSRRGSLTLSAGVSSRPLSDRPAEEARHWAQAVRERRREKNSQLFASNPRSSSVNLAPQPTTAEASAPRPGSQASAARRVPTFSREQSSMTSSTDESPGQGHAAFGSEARPHPQNPQYTMVSTDEHVPFERSYSNSVHALSRHGGKNKAYAHCCPGREAERTDDGEVDQSWCACARRCVKSLPAQSIMAILIVGNSVVLGFEADSPDLPLWNVLEHVFLGAFLFELLFKFAVVGPGELFDAEGIDFYWNVFDTVVVLLGVLDFIISLIESRGSHEGHGEEVFRIVRLLRILRIFRIVRFLRQLYLLAFGFGLATVAVFWVTVLMMFVLYVCSIIMVRTVGSSEPLDADSELLHVKFGCIYSAMLTLFDMLVRPEITPYRNTAWDHPWLALFLLCFIIFGSFGMIAVLTGVIMESMFEKNALRKEEERIELDLRRAHLIAKCKDVFTQMPMTARNEVTKDCVEALLPSFAKIFEDHGVIYARDDLDIMLDVMDADGSGSISEAEFLHFMLQMAEGVRPMLLMELFYTTHNIQSRVLRQEVTLATVHSKLDAINSKLDQLLAADAARAEREKRHAESVLSSLARGEAAQHSAQQSALELGAGQECCTKLVQELQAQLTSVGCGVDRGASQLQAEAQAASLRELEHKEFRANLDARVEELLSGVRALKLSAAAGASGRKSMAPEDTSYAPQEPPRAPPEHRPEASRSPAASAPDARRSSPARAR